MKKRKIIITLFVTIISIFVVFFGVGIYHYLKVELKNFKVLKVEKSSDTVLYFEKNQFATKYDVVVSDNEGKVIYEKTTTENKATLDEVPASYGDKINVKVVAYNKKNETKESSNNLTLVWNEPAFKNNSSYYVSKDTDYILNIEGDFSKSDYEIRIKNENNIVYTTKVDKNKIIVPYNILNNYTGRLVAELVKDNKTVVSTQNFYINVAVIGYVKIDEPINDDFATWGDLNFKYSGGAGANKFVLNIYEKEDKLIKSINLSTNEYKIPVSLLKEDTKYKLELVASYNNYDEISKKDSVIITTGIKGKLPQVYVDKNFDFIKYGEKLTLKNRFKNVSIYYTTDGSDPKSKGKLYNEPLTITDDMTIKAYAKSEYMEDSDIKTFDVRVGEKLPVVYISPSAQEKNEGIKGSGYTTEEEEMNKVADLVVPLLEKAGITVYRNDREKTITDFMNESNKVKADLHLALHSNGSANHDQTGVYVYVHDEESVAYSFASNLYDNVYNIYPFKSNQNNHGVAFAKGSLGEVSPSNVKCGVLIEYAFHDNMNEAKWIINNRKELAQATADAVINYFGMNKS